MRCKRREQNEKRLEDSSLGTVLKFIQSNHERAYRSIEREILNIFLFLANQLMESLQFILCRSLIGNKPFLPVPEQAPELLEEAIDTVNTLGIPRLRLLKRTEEHLVKPQGIGSISVADLIRIDHIVHRLRHLLNSPSTDILSVFEDELSIRILRPPSLEGFKIQAVAADNVDIDMDLCSLILILKTIGDEGIGPYDAIDKVGPTLDHSLIDKSLERFVFADISEVIEEFIPEAGVDKVTGSMFGTADIQINIPPVLIGLTADKSLIIMGIHVPQIVCAGPRESRHCALLEGPTLVGPVFSPCKRRFSVLSRLILTYFRKS